VRTVGGATGRVVVAGAGLAGLAAALHLAGRGREVTVIERAATPGGRAGRMDADGFRMDTGPTVLTMPDLVAETLAAVGESLDGRLDLIRLDPAYRAQFADGSELDVHTDADAMAEAVASFAGPAEADGYRRLRGWLTELYRREFGQFIAANFDSPLALATRVFSFQSLYAGQAPRQALAVYAVIAYMDTVAGVYFPRGGMRALPDALAGAAESAGVRFCYGSTVTALERAGSRVRAVQTDTGLRVPCDTVVLATELPAAYRLLGRTPRRPVPLRPAPSAVVVHAGAGRRWPGAAHHSILFGDAWQDTFREIITEGRLMSDPSLLVTRPTATDPGLAPDGSDLFYILAPAPNLARGRIEWDVTAGGYADQLASLVDKRLLPGLDAQITMRRVVTPADWAREGLVAGTPFSFAHSFLQSGPFRPGNMPRGTDNVVLAGCGTVPGVGVPTALISGRLAADRITGPVRARAVVPAGRPAGKPAGRPDGKPAGTVAGRTAS
jgi:phytoene desaturase